MCRIFSISLPIPILISAGASSDVEVATKIARTMVTKYAMSEKVSTYQPVFVSDRQKLYVMEV